MLKADLEENLEIRITKTSFATIESIRYLKLLPFHQVKISKEVSLRSSQAYAKYFSNSYLLSSFPPPLNAC
jgi:hypothetical protein